MVRCSESLVAYKAVTARQWQRGVCNTLKDCPLNSRSSVHQFLVRRSLISGRLCLELSE
jgi:hypothetical protein